MRIQQLISITVLLLFLHPANAERQDMLATINLVDEPIWQRTDLNAGKRLAAEDQLRAAHDNRQCLSLDTEIPSTLSMQIKDSMGIEPLYYEGIGIQFINTVAEESTVHQLRLHINHGHRTEKIWLMPIEGKSDWTTLFLPFSGFQSSDDSKLDKRLISSISIVTKEQKAQSSLCLSDLYFYTRAEVW